MYVLCVFCPSITTVIVVVDRASGACAARRCARPPAPVPRGARAALGVRARLPTPRCESLSRAGRSLSSHVAGTWRVMYLAEGFADLLFNDRSAPRYLKRVGLVAAGAHRVRERRRVLHVNSIGTTINRFGEPPEGPAHFPIHDLELGVRMLTSRELWRLQGGSQLRAKQPGQRNL